MLTSRKTIDGEINVQSYSLQWICVAPGGVPYFTNEDGTHWTSISQNDTINGPELNNLFRRKDFQQVDNHLKWLNAHGGNVLRLMLEYCQKTHRYFERPVGKFQPDLVQLWDDLFSICEKNELRILLPLCCFFSQKHKYFVSTPYL